MFDLLICDVDGVLTDGTKLYDVNGNVVAKQFYDRDFTAIKRFKKAGVEVVWLSGDRRVNEAIANQRKIDFYFARDNKASFIPFFEEKYKVNRSKMAYLGDDIYDLPVLKEVGYGFVPSTAEPELFEHAEVLERKPGHGFITSVYERRFK